MCSVGTFANVVAGVELGSVKHFIIIFMRLYYYLGLAGCSTRAPVSAMSSTRLSFLDSLLSEKAP